MLPFLNELAEGVMDDLEVAMSRSAGGLLVVAAVSIMTFFLQLPANGQEAS
jgi:hypothetical protein